MQERKNFHIFVQMRCQNINHCFLPCLSGWSYIVCHCQYIVCHCQSLLPSFIPWRQLVVVGQARGNLLTGLRVFMRDELHTVYQSCWLQKCDWPSSPQGPSNLRHYHPPRFQYCCHHQAPRFGLVTSCLPGLQGLILRQLWHNFTRRKLFCCRKTYATRHTVHYTTLWQFEGICIAQIYLSI